MSSFIALICLLLSAVFIYKKRFTSGIKIGGLYLVQLYYLFVTPIGALLLFDIGSDVFSRVTVGNLPIPNNILFNSFNFSVMMAVVGVGIHSTSTSVYQSFKKKGQLEQEAYRTNELFHGPWSHNMAQLGSILCVMFLGLLEINHPYSGQAINSNLLLVSGVTIGLMGAVTVLRSAHIGFPLVISLFGSVLLGFSVRNYASNTESFPMATIALFSLMTMFISLSITAIIFAVSEKWSRKIVKRAFPKGHRFHQGIDIQVLTMRIEKDFAQERESKIYY